MDQIAFHWFIIRKCTLFRHSPIFSFLLLFVSFPKDFVKLYDIVMNCVVTGICMIIVIIVICTGCNGCALTRKAMMSSDACLIDPFTKGNSLLPREINLERKYYELCIISYNMIHLDMWQFNSSSSNIFCSW